MIDKVSSAIRIFFLLFLLYPQIELFAAEYHVDKEQENVVKFISDAPLEDFEGVTDKIDGYIFWQGDDLTNKSDMYIEVDLNSLDTGIGLRNRHMREDYLETDKYPFTHFKGKIIEIKKESDSEYSVEAEGKIFIHGIENDLIVDGKMKTIGDKIHIQTKFNVKLSEFKIDIPSLMFFKINENMAIHLDFYVKRVNNN